jgi:hypothetical protein
MKSKKKTGSTKKTTKKLIAAKPLHLIDKAVITTK